MTRDGDPFFASDGRPEPSVDPVYPGDEPPALSDGEARQYVVAGLRLGLEIYATCKTTRRLALLHAALAHISTPELNVTSTARRLGVHRKTIHAHIRRLRRAFGKLLIRDGYTFTSEAPEKRLHRMEGAP